MGFLNTFFQLLTGNPHTAQQPPQADMRDERANWSTDGVSAEDSEYRDPAQPGDYVPQRTVQEPEAYEKPVVQNAGVKTIPIVIVTTTKCRENGDHMDVYGFIQNKSTVQIELDKITLFGQKRELDNFLYPGESREFLLYQGPMLQSQTQPLAAMQYKVHETGDYFISHHYPQMLYNEHNKLYYLEELRFQPPIQDL